MNHPLASERILKEMGHVPEAAIAIAGQHQEKVNGSGYPRGLTENQMHPFASMAPLADIYDALTSARPLQTGAAALHCPPGDFDGKGTEFLEQVVETFIKQLGIYPVGSFVKLNTGEMGIVMEVNPEDSVRPKVGILFSNLGKQQYNPFLIDIYQEYLRDGPGAGVCDCSGR